MSGRLPILLRALMSSSSSQMEVCRSAMMGCSIPLTRYCRLAISLPPRNRHQSVRLLRGHNVAARYFRAFATHERSSSTSIRVLHARHSNALVSFVRWLWSTERRLILSRYVFVSCLAQIAHRCAASSVASGTTRRLRRIALTQPAMLCRGY